MKTVHLPSRQVLGIALRTTNENRASASEIPPHKERFTSEGIYDQIPHKTTGDILGFYTDYESDFTKPYTLIYGCEVSTVDKIPEGLTLAIAPASKYAVYEINGEFPESLLQTWGEIWESDLKRTYTADFEVYPVDFDPINNPKMQLYISIKS